MAWLVFFSGSDRIGSCDERRVFLKEADKGGNGFKAFQGSNKESSYKGMLTGAIGAAAEIKFGEIRQIKFVEDFFIFSDNRQAADLVKGYKKR